MGRYDLGGAEYFFMQEELENGFSEYRISINATRRDRKYGRI